ncbi:unnamed protein product [Polarella glacialis]|uniref:Uncharacterized protein n=1 Tax=Polarella glacialis TaxID=89957 RepID=A0A813GH92_POLGL|nr:unnamed protein product [Polarella glacialis]
MTARDPSRFNSKTSRICRNWVRAGTIREQRTLGHDSKAVIHSAQSTHRRRPRLINDNKNNNDNDNDNNNDNNNNNHNNNNSHNKKKTQRPPTPSAGLSVAEAKPLGDNSNNNSSNNSNNNNGCNLCF